MKILSGLCYRREYSIVDKMLSDTENVPIDTFIMLLRTTYPWRSSLPEWDNLRNRGYKKTVIYKGKDLADKIFVGLL